MLSLVYYMRVHGYRQRYGMRVFDKRKEMLEEYAPVCLVRVTEYLYCFLFHSKQKCNRQRALLFEKLVRCAFIISFIAWPTKVEVAHHLQYGKRANYRHKQLRRGLLVALLVTVALRAYQQMDRKPSRIIY